MRPHRPLLILAALLGTALSASAQQGTAFKLKPGLWEHGFTMGAPGGPSDAAMKQMQQSMASLPPEQRKMMEDMMAKQGLGIGPKGNTIRICLSKEDVERDAPPQEPGCTQTSRRSGNVWQVSFQCKGPPPSSGEGQMTLQNPGAYSGNFTVRTVDKGKTEQFTMSQTGKWLSADCGNIRPASAIR